MKKTSMEKGEADKYGLWQSLNFFNKCKLRLKPYILNLSKFETIYNLKCKFNYTTYSEFKKKYQ